MNLDDRQRAAGPLVQGPRHRLVAVAALFSPSARAAGAVALERLRGERARRLVAVAGRCHPGTAAPHSAADAFGGAEPAGSVGLVGYRGPSGSGSRRSGRYAVGDGYV
jgi:hypothetical protein